MALPEQLNYTQHIDALGIKKDRIGLAPNNGSSFICNTGNIQFEVPCQQMSRFADFTNAYIAFDITNTDAQDLLFPGQLGTIALQDKLTVETTSNKKFSEVDNVNALWDAKLSQSVADDWYAKNGACMFAMGATPTAGVTLGQGAGNKRRFIMPVAMSGLCEHRHVPLLGRENIRFRIDLAQAKTVFDGATDGNQADSEITIDNVLLYYDVVTLSDEQMKGLLNATGGKFIISGTDYYHQNAQIATTSRAENISMGCSRRKAKKLIGIIRTLDDITDGSVNSFSRNKLTIDEITVKLNGIKVGQSDLPSNASTAPEVYAELMKSAQGGLLSLHDNALGTDTLFNLAEGDASSDATIGRFMFEVDLTTGLETDGSVSGLNVMTGNFNLELSKTANSTDTQYLDIFIEYHSEYVLDMNAGATWMVYN